MKIFLGSDKTIGNNPDGFAHFGRSGVWKPSLINYLGGGNCIYHYKVDSYSLKDYRENARNYKDHMSKVLENDKNVSLLNLHKIQSSHRNFCDLELSKNELKEIVLMLQKGTCWGPHCIEQGKVNISNNGNPLLKLHRIKWEQFGGEYIPSNVVGLCPICHVYIHRDKYFSHKEEERFFLEKTKQYEILWSRFIKKGVL